MLSDQAAPKRVLVLATGGTIFQRAVPKEQGPGAVMQLGVAPAEFFAAHAHCWPGAVCEVRDLQVRSGAELSWATVFRVRDAVAEALQQDGGEVSEREHISCRPAAKLDKTRGGQALLTHFALPGCCRLMEGSCWSRAQIQWRSSVLP